MLVYHGARARAAERARLGAAAELARFDVVLTSYPTLEHEYRRVLDEQKVTCGYCAKRMLPRLVVHLRYFCGPDAERSEKLRKRDRNQDVANEKAMATLKIRAARRRRRRGAARRCRAGNIYKEPWRTRPPAIGTYEPAPKVSVADAEAAVTRDAGGASAAAAAAVARRRMARRRMARRRRCVGGARVRGSQRARPSAAVGSYKEEEDDDEGRGDDDDAPGGGAAAGAAPARDGARRRPRPRPRRALAQRWRSPPQQRREGGRGSMPLSIGDAGARRQGRHRRGSDDDDDDGASSPRPRRRRRRTPRGGTATAASDADQSTKL